MQVCYQKHLYLTTLYPRRMRDIGFSPSPAIDLVLHAHLLHPRAYFDDTHNLCFGVRHHLMYPNQAMCGRSSSDSVAKMAALWESEFGEPVTALPLHSLMVAKLDKAKRVAAEQRELQHMEQMDMWIEHKP
jgi:hypothetical protein